MKETTLAKLMIHFTFFHATRRFAQERILKIKKSQPLESKSKPTRAISGQRSAVSDDDSYNILTYH